MVRGLYIASTGMLTQRRLMENTTNNIVNAETTGFKKDYLITHSFDDVMIRRVNDSMGQNRQVGPFTYGVQVDQKYTNFEQGPLESTGKAADMALVGDAFYAVSTPAGERYTRAGSFLVNEQGYLTNGDGYYVLGSGGDPLYIGSQDFTVTEVGTVYVGTQQRGQLRIVSFEDNDSLRKIGDNLYSGDGAEQSTEYAVKQRFLEASNVEIGREMVDMMTIYRAYETNQRMITMIDETVGMAATEIGRLR